MLDTIVLVLVSFIVAALLIVFLVITVLPYLLVVLPLSIIAATLVKIFWILFGEDTNENKDNKL